MRFLRAPRGKNPYPTKIKYRSAEGKKTPTAFLV
jgi:hypothetical protein